jgi:hypothetical protein
MALSWIKCEGDVWCKLSTVNLSHEHFNSMYGVYIIWHGGSNAATVRVGQGFIRDRLSAHRNDPEVQAYARHTLYVTWASVSSASRDGVEAFLSQRLQPLVGERFPSVAPFEVNLPW